jgi:HNH endonuclease
MLHTCQLPYSPHPRGFRSIARLLFGNDLCRFPRGSKSGQWGPCHAAVLNDSLLQPPAGRAKASFPAGPHSPDGMKQIRARLPRLRLDGNAYTTLRNQVLNRDSWRCQFCGSMSNLELHHQLFRSQAGSDTEQNLITLCSTCHKAHHHG